MNVSHKELKSAYQLVTQDLFSRLLKAQDQQTVYLGPRGAFGSLKKTEQHMVSHMRGKSYGKTYAFYRLNFKPSRQLKAALNKALEKKYRKK